MKFSKTSGIIALGLASNAVADSTWSDWDPTTSTASATSTSSSSWSDWDPSTSADATTTSSSTTSWGDWDPTTSSSVAAASTTSSTWADWSPKVAAASSSSTCKAMTVTETSTTTVYRSTVFVGPGPATTVTVWGSGSPAAPVAAASSPAWSSPVAAASSPVAAASSPAWSSPVAAASGAAAPGWSASGSPAAAASASAAWGSGSSVTPVAGSASTGGWNGGNWGSLKPGDGSVVATGDAVYTWTGEAPTGTKSYAAPEYTGWTDWTPGSNSSGSSNSTGPAPGSASSNLTAPITGHEGSSCNSASDRSVWCGGKSTSSDYYSEDYSTGHVCAYDFTITNTTLDFDGTPQLALAINGQVPGPLIECNWGDTIQVKVTNLMQDNATSIHWHGITHKHTNDQDGVPGVTECAIAPGTSRTYSYRASSYGTGWYHSHYITQYGDGIRGPMIIHGPATANYDIDMGTVMIDDTFPLGHTAAQQNDLIAHLGPTGTANYLLNGQNVKPDLSAGKHTLWSVQPGKKHLFRLINSASQNMWSVHFDNHKMTVIASDYVPIVPYTTEWVNIGIGQRFDVIVEMDQPTAGYFLRAVTQTGCPSGCANSGLGNANGIFLYEGASNTLPTSTPGNVTAANFAICADEPITSLVPFLKKSAGSSSAFGASASTLPAGAVANVSTSDDGFVFRWFLNNGAIDIDYTQPTLKSLAESASSNGSISNPITLPTGNVWVYFVIQNQFFASHPIHLHGHDLSLLGQGNVPWTPALVSTLNFDNPPRRDTAMLAGSPGPGAPPGYTVIGFETDNPGAWLMHCHIVWHVDGGLALQFVERPSDIPAVQYASKPDFQSECSSMAAWEAESPAHKKTSGESGLKRRTYMDTLLDQHNDVVRRSDSAEKRYLDSFVKRGLGDGYKPRHGARR